MSKEFLPTEEPSLPPDPLGRSGQVMKLVVSWIVVTAVTGFGGFLLMRLTTVAETEGTFWRNQVEQNFPVVVGLPLAALGSLFISLVLQISAGPVEIEAVGIKFKGASAPIVFWVLCFLSMAAAMKLLWVPPG